MSDPSNYLPPITYYPLEKTYNDITPLENSIMRFGQGYKLRGVDMEKFGIGFNPELFETGSSEELLRVELQRWILRKVYLIFDLVILLMNQFDKNWGLFTGIVMMWLQIIVNFIGIKSLQIAVLMYREPTTVSETLMILQWLHNWDLPPNLLILVTLQKFTLTPPPPLPELYLTSDKQLIEPTKKQIDELLDMNSKYVNEMIFFKQNEIFSKLINLSKIICYCLVLGIKSVRIYESDGLLWGEGNVIKLVEFIIAELEIMKFDMSPLLKINNYQDGICYGIKMGKLVEIDHNLDNATIVSLLSSNQNPKKLLLNQLQKDNVIEQLQIDNELTRQPNLILNINKSNKLNYDKLYGFNQISITPQQSIIYSESNELTMATIINSLRHYNKNL